MKSTFTKFALAATLLTLVSAHGYIGTIQVDGNPKTYVGPTPKEVQKGSPPSDTPIRQVPDNGAVRGDPDKLAQVISSPDMACGKGSPAPAPGVVEVKPGSMMNINWTNIAYGGNGNWIHEWGPMSLWIAKCGDTTCDKFSASDAANADWYKIAALGFKSGETWYHENIHQGKPLKFQLPDSLPKGDYLLRSEVIADHQTSTEFYPSCIQIRFTESPKSTKTPSNGVKITKAYKADEPGLKEFIPQSGVDASSFVMPGPALSNIAMGNEGSLNGGTDKTGSASGSAGSSSSAAAPAPTSYKRISRSRRHMKRGRF